MILDLHVHTVYGGWDSSLRPEELIEEARRIGLDGVCLTEHSRIWDRHDLRRFAAANDFVVFRGIELGTELGHITALGLDGYVSGIHRASALAREVKRAHGFTIAVHPLRHLITHPASLTEATLSLEWPALAPLFSLVDALEVFNGGCTDEENQASRRAARALRKKATAGSDAHSVHGLGCCATVFERTFEGDRALIEELRAGRYYAAQRLMANDGCSWPRPPPL